MEIFECRTRATAELETTFRNEAEVINNGFLLLDRCIADLGSRFNTSTLARAASLATAKGDILAQGCYSLILDGLAQESGALLRTLLEVAEFLTYLHSNSNAQEEFKEDKLPSAGVIAQRIDGKLQVLRKYLNEDASHLNFSYNSLRHIVTFSNPVVFNTHPQFHKNLKMLFTFLLYVLSAAATCIAQDKSVPLETEPLAVDVANYRVRGSSTFHITV